MGRRRLGDGELRADDDRATASRRSLSPTTARRSGWRPDVRRRRGHGDEPQPLEDRLLSAEASTLEQAVASLAGEVGTVHHGCSIDPTSTPRGQRGTAPKRREIGPASTEARLRRRSSSWSSQRQRSRWTRINTAFLRTCPPGSRIPCQTASSRATMRSKSAVSVTSRSETASGSTGGPAIRATGAISTVSSSSGTNPDARSRPGGRPQVARGTSTEPPAPIREDVDLARDQVVERGSIQVGEVAIEDEPPLPKPVNRTIGPSRSTSTPGRSRSGTRSRSCELYAARRSATAGVCTGRS